MPTPIFQPYAPGVNETPEGKVKNLLNAYVENTQQLQWLLSHLDEKNVLKAKAVIADWIYANTIEATQINAGTLNAGVIYAGDITTDQLTAGSALIANALIESLSASKITAGTLDLTDSILIKGDKLETIIDQYGMDVRFIKWFKNMAFNSSFELFDESTSIPTYWDGGISTNASNFFGTYSLKLLAGESSAQTDDACVNPQWYNDIAATTRVSFHKKGGTVKIEVLDVDSAEAAYTLTDEDGNTGAYIEYASNANWVPQSYTVSFTHGASTAIRVKFTNTDGADAAYIDGLILEPDYTGKRPSFYTDGANSTGNELVGGAPGAASYFTDDTNAAEVTAISASETVIVTKDITFAQRSKIIITFSCEVTFDGAANLTAKMYVDGTALTLQPTHYYATANTFTFSYTDRKKGIAAGTKTVAVKLQTDANIGTIAIGQAVMIIQVFADSTPAMPNPTGFGLTVIDDD